MILVLPWISMLAAFAMLFIPKENERLLKSLTLTSCAVSSLTVLALTLQFNPAQTGYQFLQRFEWIPSLGIHYQAGLDGLNLTMCLLNAIVSLAGAFLSCSNKERLKSYLVFYLILTGALYGVLTSLNVFFLYLFYETTVIAVYPLISIWGSGKKEYAAIKMALFTATGAVIALYGFLVLYHQAGPQVFDLVWLRDNAALLHLSGDFQKSVIPFLLIGFGIISSLWPFHSWAPSGYGSAPASAAMLHAGVKVGPYLILRFVIPFLPEGFRASADCLAMLATIGVLYAGYAALQQKETGLMLGFSGVSHLGYVFLGLSALNVTAVSGAVLLIFSHGLLTACLFGINGVLYEQTQKRGISEYGGLAKAAPFLSVCLIMASMASLGMPGFANFASEVLIFIGAWRTSPVLVAFAVFGILVTALYLLRMVQSICYGPMNPALAKFKDASTWTERFPFLLLLAGLLLFGFWPQGLLKIIEPAVGVILS